MGIGLTWTAVISPAATERRIRAISVPSARVATSSKAPGSTLKCTLSPPPLQSALAPSTVTAGASVKAPSQSAVVVMTVPLVGSTITSANRTANSAKTSFGTNANL
ncbi:MAG: hypothetical protein JRI55_16295 [Deltaproteobacteria bacterium]|nr:hypothetical protein [Deltaproteobacteria bacterium]